MSNQWEPEELVCENGSKCDHPYCPDHCQEFEADKPWTWPVKSSLPLPQLQLFGPRGRW
jgi:hypothetical protein